MIYPIMMISLAETEIATDSIDRFLQVSPELLPLITVVLNGVETAWFSDGMKSMCDRIRPVRLPQTDILPIAVSGRRRKICDLRDTSLAQRWRWARGSRYFEVEHVLQNDWSVLHPLKSTPADRAIRAALPPVSGIRFSS